MSLYWVDYLKIQNAYFLAPEVGGGSSSSHSTHLYIPITAQSLRRFGPGFNLLDVKDRDLPQQEVDYALKFLNSTTPKRHSFFSQSSGIARTVESYVRAAEEEHGRDTALWYRVAADAVIFGDRAEQIRKLQDKELEPYIKNCMLGLTYLIEATGDLQEANPDIDDTKSERTVALVSKVIDDLAIFGGKDRK